MFNQLQTNTFKYKYISLSNSSEVVNPSQETIAIPHKTGMKLKLFQVLLAFCLFSILYFNFKESVISSSYFLQTFGGTEEDEEILSNGLAQFYNISPFKQIVENLFSLSAFYDERSDGIKILGIALKEFPNVTCAYFSADDPGWIEVVSGNAKCLMEHALRTDMFVPIWIECPLEKSTLLEYNETLQVQVIVDSVAESHDDYNITREGHFIEKSPRDNETSPYKYKMAMCIQPLFNYEDPTSLAEWIEFHTLLGVEHFTFYNMSIGPKTSKLLRSYNSSQIRIRPWILPFDNTIQKLNYHGQLLQINDCLYRYKGVSEFVGFVDVDEFITPGDKYLANFTTYDQFFQDLFAEREPELVAGVTFKSQFSFSNFPRVNLTDPIANHLRILTRPNLASSWQFMYKTKVVLRPELVQEEEVHWPTVVTNGTTVLDAPEEDVFFIHYRLCDAAYLKYFCAYNCTTCDDIRYNEETILDVMFGNVVLQNVKNRLQLSQI